CLYALLSSRTLFSSTTPPPTPLYTLSLHDALPISAMSAVVGETEYTSTFYNDTNLVFHFPGSTDAIYCSGCNGSYQLSFTTTSVDRKSTRLNSSHRTISYAVFCLKKKKKSMENQQI